MCPMLSRSQNSTEFGGNVGLVIEKAPTEKMGNLILKSILPKYEFSLLLCQWKGKREGHEVTHRLDSLLQTSGHQQSS